MKLLALPVGPVGRLAALLSVASVAIAACSPVQPVAAPTASGGVTASGALTIDPLVPAPPAPSSAATPSAPTPPVIPPPSIRFPLSNLAVRAGEPFVTRKLPSGHALGRGHVVLPLLDEPNRAAVAVAGGHGALVDTTTGRILVTTPTAPDVVAPRARAVVLRGKPLRILSTDRLQVVTPAVDAGARTLTWIEPVAMARRSALLAIGEDGNGEKLMGRVSADFAHVTLHTTELRAADDNVYTFERSPLDAFELIANTRDTAGRAGTPFSLPHQPGCVRVRVEDDGRATCLDYRPMTAMGSGDSVTMLSGGWFMGYDPARSGHDNAFVSHVSWGEGRLAEDDLHTGRDCHVLQTRTEPPRVLFGCHSPESIALWSPAALYTAALPGGAPSDAGLPADGAVVPLRHWADGGTGPLATLWVDLVRGRLAETAPLQSLAWAPESGVLDRSLATDDHGALWLLDVAGESRERLEDATGCPGVLHEEIPEGADSSRFRALTCFARPAKGRVESQIRWSEVVDLQRRTMYKTNQRIVSWHGDGTVILSTTTNIEAETPTSPGDLSAVNVVDAR